MADLVCCSCGTVLTYTSYCTQCYHALEVDAKALRNYIVTYDTYAQTASAQRDATIDALEQEVVALNRQLQDAAWQPQPGIWLVTEQPGVRSQSWLAQGDVPEPVTLAKLYQWRDMIAQGVLKAWQDYTAKGSQSPNDVATIILDYLYQETTKP